MSAQRSLEHRKVVFLATDGFEQVELTEPKKALEEAGAEVFVVAPKPGEIKGWNHREWGDSIHVDRELERAEPTDYDALVLPGGVMNPDRLRQDPKAVEFVSAFMSSGRPVAAICHGPWMLVEADAVKGRMLTSWPSLKTDIRNAGGRWVDDPVVTDGNLTTSRKPEDIPVFNERIIQEFAFGQWLRAAS